MNNLEWIIAIAGFSLVLLYRNYLYWQLRDSQKNFASRPQQQEDIRFNYPPYRVPILGQKKTRNRDREQG